MFGANPKGHFPKDERLLVLKSTTMSLSGSLEAPQISASLLISFPAEGKTVLCLLDWFSGSSGA